MTKIAGSGTGYISQRHGSGDPDPDPLQNVMDPQHWLRKRTFWGLEKRAFIWPDGLFNSVIFWLIFIIFQQKISHRDPTSWRPATRGFRRIPTSQDLHSPASPQQTQTRLEAQFSFSASLSQTGRDKLLLFRSSGSQCR